MEGAIVQVLPDEILYRASGLGSCLRALVAARLEFHALPPPKALDSAFKQGHALELAIINRMVEKGWQEEPNSAQHSVRLHVGTLDTEQKLVIVGHLDRLMFPPGGDHYLPVDAKSFSQSTWDDFFRKGIKGYPRYGWQQSVYSEGVGTSRFCLALYNKDTGEQEERIYQQVFDYSEIQGRVYEVEEWAIKINTGSATISQVPCSGEFGCPYAFVHDERPTDSIPTDILDLVRSYHIAQAKEKFYKGVREGLRDQIIPKTPYTDDLRTFFGSGLRLTVQANSRRLDTNKVLALLEEAGLDIDDYYIPGTGVHIVVAPSEGNNAKGQEA